MSVKFSDSVKYIGVDDTTIDLFESQYVVPKGVSYNSYVILDDKVALMDTVDKRGMEQWEKAYEEMLPFFKKQTALFFSSDYYALEASNFLQNRGIKVPEEISIAGFDDVTYATLARPKLTTVHQMVDGKARRAVEVLMHLIQDEPVQKDIPPLPTTLVERESVRDLTK